MRRMHLCLLLLRRPSVESSSSSSSSSLTYCTLKQQQSDRSRYRRLSSLSPSPPTTTSFTNSKCRVIYTVKTLIFSSVLRLKKCVEKRHQVQTGPVLRHSHHRQQQQSTVNSTSHLKRISKAQFILVKKRATHYNIYRSNGDCTFLLCWFLSLMKIYFDRVSIRVLICQDEHSTSVERGGCGERRGKITILPLASAWPLSIPIRIHYTLYLSVCVFLCLSFL